MLTYMLTYAQVTCVVHLCPKEGFTEEQIAPSWKTEFVGTLEALLVAVRGNSQAEPPPADSQAEPPPAEAEAEAPPAQE